MFSRSVLNKSLIVSLQRQLIINHKDFSSSTDSPDSDKFTPPKSKYKIFQDKDSPIILDVGEEQMIYRKKQEHIMGTGLDEKEPAVYTRGVTGVFDVEELVETLQKDNAKDIFVVKVPKELKYVDYLVIATGRSKRHLLGLSEFVRSIYKKKKDSSDITPKIEGENSSEWIAMDLGNIALHIMSHDARLKYDLESLWSIGPEYDVLLNSEENTIVQLLKKHSVLLDDIQPLQRG